MMESLSTPEQAELAQCVATIERGIQSFYETGLAILKLRNGRLYRQTHSSLESFLKDRFGLERSRAYQLLYAAEVCSNLQSSEVLPENEHQLRPLATLPAKDQRKVWNKALAINGGESPSARQIKELRDSLFPELAGRKQGRPVEATEAPNQDENPEAWLEELQRLAREQRESEWKLADHFAQGENKFGQADKLVAEIDFQGPPISLLKRHARVAARIKPSDRPAMLPIQVADSALSVGLLSLVERGESEERIKEAIAEVRKAESVKKQEAANGVALEADEIKDEFFRMFDRIWLAVTRHFGESEEGQLLVLANEFLASRRDWLKIK